MAASLAFLAGSLHAQQAPQYAYPPQTYGQQAPAYPPSAQQYQTPPGVPGYGYQPQQSYPAPPQQGYGYAPPPQSYNGGSQYVSPVEFLPTFGRKFGQMFRRVFYGDAPPQGYQGQVQQPRGNLDAGPPSYGSHYGAPPQQGYPPPGYSYPPQPQAPGGYPPRYETPPVQQAAPRTAAPAPQAPSTSRTNSGSSNAPRLSLNKKPQSTAPSTAGKTSTPSKKYTPPTLSRTPETPKPQVDESPPPTPKPSYTAPAEPEPRVSEKLPGSKPKPADSGSSSAGTASSGTFLKGKRTGKEGRVVSPYPPYQELDVTGLSSGSLALDPTTQKVFEVP